MSTTDTEALRIRFVGFTVGLVLLLAAPNPARAEMAFFANGRHLSIKGHRVEQGALVLELRAGGEIVCDPSAITRIAPDEVPYPEPQLAPAGIGTPALEPAEPGFGTAGAATRYEALIDEAAAAHGVDARLVRAVIQAESGFDARARSSKGAMGLMQLMPDTARQYAVANPYDPRANIEAGTRHLRSLLDQFPVREALAAYNAGAAAVTHFGGVPPYAETRTYIARVLSLARISTR